MRQICLWLCVGLPLAGCGDQHDALMRELNHRSPVIRAGAVKSLAKLGDDTAYTLVSRSLEDRSAIVRIAAVRALGDFKDRDTGAGLVRATLDRDPEVREAAVLELQKKKDETGRKALVRLLLKGEPVTRVRKAAYQALEEFGLSGERLSREMAETQLVLAREVLQKGASSERVGAIRQAGRSVHPDGIGLVVEGLVDQEQDVVLAALGELQGRGGQPALRQLQLLLSDPLDAIRVASVRALGAQGADGLKLLEPAFRDPEAQVRLAALEVYEQHSVAAPAALLCQVLADPDPRVALRAAGLLHGRAAGCGLESLQGMLKQPDSEAGRQAVGVLASLGGPAAIELLEATLNRAAGADSLHLVAALARAGQRRAEIGRALGQAFDRALEQIGLLEAGWVTGKLPPTGPDSAAVAPEVDRSRLSEEELNRLYAKHGLGPAGEQSPRGVGDILAGFEDPDQVRDHGRLFEAVPPELIDAVSMSLDGLLFISPDKAGDAVGRALASRSPGLVARVARILLTHNVTVQPSAELLDSLQAALRVASQDQAQDLLTWLTSSRDERLVPLLLISLGESAFDKRLAVIEALGRLGDPRAIGSLAQQLASYSASPAARALAQIGDPAAIEPLRGALGSAGPAEELEIELALARLGDRELLPRVLEKLDAANPDIRCSAVRVLGQLGGEQELDAIRGLRYDLDRLVRRAVEQALDQGKTGDEADGGPKKRAQGRSGRPAEEGKVHQGP